MVQHKCACGGAQHCGVFTVLVRTSELRGEEPGTYGNAYASMLGSSAIPLVEGTWGKSRRVGRKDQGLRCYAPGPPVSQRLP